MKTSRRELLGAATGALTAMIAPVSKCHAEPQPTVGAITPEMFGAKGDGVSNDTRALAAMAAYVNARGGGEIWFRKATYVVGLQNQAHGSGVDYAFAPEKVMEFTGCSRPLVIHGNGARIKCAPGLRFGTFDPRSGRETRRKSPNYMRGELSSPYHWMIKVSGCTGAVEIADLELDGSLDALRVGGPWGDTGHQIGTMGIGLVNNRGREILRNLYLHHHAVDGLLIDGLDADRAQPSLIENVRSLYNARQGCSIVGGRGYRFLDCEFSHTGKGGLASSPGGGVDVEAEAGKKVRDLSFQRCRFANNIGPGLVADQGDSAGASFADCTFIGTTSWSAWPKKPRFRFQACAFVGPISNCFGSVERPDDAVKFYDCTFRDDPSLSPTGKVYKPPLTDGPIADLPGNPNVLFSRCKFLLTHAHALPWTTNVVIFADCTMEQASTKPAYPRGTYVGRNTIRGNVDLYSAIVKGPLTVNGRPQPLTP